MKFALLLFCLCLCSCRRGMVDQPHAKTFTADPLNPAESSARPIPPHTVARGHLDEDQPFFTGMTNGLLVTVIPLPINRELLARGRERFDIYCAVCHGPAGDGNGMIVQRGFPRPPSFHDPRLRDAPVGHFFDVINHGYGVMYSYASRVPPADRWAIIAYIRALQASQHTPLAELPPREQARLEEAKSR